MYNVSRHQSLLPNMPRLGARLADAGSFDEAATGSRAHLHVAKGKTAHSEVCIYLRICLAGTLVMHESMVQTQGRRN